MPAPNLAFYKKLRKEFNEVSEYYHDTTDDLDREIHGYGLGDRTSFHITLSSLKDLDPLVKQLSNRIAIMLEANELKEKAKSEFEKMLKDLSSYESDINFLIRDIEDMLSY
ncbi:hypothetical protein VO178_09690 [Lysinibacillus fusiformis]|uniref:hypothetical protein n=1 Tax=Lysinibacillus fusiformis TaxID=28031 RepID=UPI002D788787|nr:hypothetical protein [Lysinibacillus fusiformis]WRS99946.1 hypothetical protein VO178_09690 [Lysinibacillus fusiformis]